MFHWFLRNLILTYVSYLFYNTKLRYPLNQHSFFREARQKDGWSSRLKQHHNSCFMSYTKDYIIVFQTVSGISVITCSVFVTLKYTKWYRPLEKQSKLPCGTETKVEALILCSQSYWNWWESRIIGKKKKKKKGMVLWLLVLQNEINFQSHIKQSFKENVSQTILEESQPSPTRQLLKQIFWFNVLLKQYLMT